MNFWLNFWLALALLGLAPGALAQEASTWAQGHSSRVRLLGGAPALAGVQIELEAGFKTYWRTPGEAGLPPTFDWSKSVNVESVEVLWPAPARFEDPGGIVYGYQGGVVLPVRVRPQDAGKPVSLSLKIDYGVCKDICIPAQAELSLRLPKSPSPPIRASLEGALARVPRAQPVKAEGELSILGAEPSVVDGKARLAITVKAPTGKTPALFVEPPDNRFMLAPAEPAASAQDPGTRIFLVEVLEKPIDASGPIDLRLTLVGAEWAVETTMTLDAGRLGR
jgi:DsbC/DsbD-like thiol-disulfide interchange protein